MGTKNNPGRFDCYQAAGPDEPMFVLLARDRHAPTLVRIWALLRDQAGDDEDKVEEALQCAADMIAWRGDQPKRKALDDKEREKVAQILMAATTGMITCPAGYDAECACNSCTAAAR